MRDTQKNRPYKNILSIYQEEDYQQIFGIFHDYFLPSKFLSEVVDFLYLTGTILRKVQMANRHVP